MQITNTIQDKNEIIVFYRFDNEENSNRFPITAQVGDIFKWGEDREDFLKQREIDLQTKVEEIQQIIMEAE
jgi:hypothetical protein